MSVFAREYRAGVTRRSFLGGAVAFAAAPSAFAAASPGPYETAGGRASDPVMVRRLYLDLAGRLPTAEEAREYVASAAADKRARLVDRLLKADSFADLWSMRFCDILRVKSEFPINLWPNAVYVYHRRIRAFVLADEPWDRFARALLTATGSDFRDAEANFFRATAQRTPEGYAEAAAQTFLGEGWRAVPGTEGLADYFRSVRVKTTREWKEEVVLVEGEDRRPAFCARLFGEWREAFAAAFVRRVDGWLLSRAAADPAHVAAFRAKGLRLKPLVRAIVLSDAYARGPVTGGFPCRRLEAEVLEDVLCDLTGMTRAYQSIAPEPFTFLPPERRSVLVEDGSISSAFLTLFGRPARDTGRMDERQNGITAKQRLYLFSSGRLHQALGRMQGADRAFGRLPPRRRIDELYWRFLSRPPTGAESNRLMARFEALQKGRERGQFHRDLAWALMNSREFLYQH